MAWPNDRMRKPDLTGAYALDGADAIRTLYADWATSYEANFAQSMDYRLPAEVAAAFMAAGGVKGPVLDIGAGTGLLAQALRGLGFAGEIDAVDLSAEMLAQAARKGLYRTLFEADITRPLPVGAQYSGMVSSGTFTHGHVGPEALIPLLQSAAPGARVVLSVNQAVYERLGFGPALQALGPTLRDLTLTEVAIYGKAAQSADPDRAADQALIVSFRTR